MTMIVEFYIPEKERNNAIDLFRKGQKFSEANAKKIENGVYDFTKQYCYDNDSTIYVAVYKDKIKDLIYNCEQNGPTIYKLKKEISKGKYDSYNLPFLSPAQLNAETWEKIISRKMLSEEKLNSLPKVSWKPCKDCKNNQYMRYQLQTRSADEPITQFYICGVCKRTYRINV